MIKVVIRIANIFVVSDYEIQIINSTEALSVTMPLALIMQDITALQQLFFLIEEVQSCRNSNKDALGCYANSDRINSKFRIHQSCKEAHKKRFEDLLDSNFKCNS